MQYRIKYSDSLEHHGIQGMKWGQRNGPPYPLQPFQKRVGNAVAKGRAVIKNAISEAGQRARTKAEAEIAKKRANAEELEKRKAEAAKRKKLIEMAKKHPELLSDYELQQLNNRAQQEQNFNRNYLTKKGQNAVKETGNSLFKDVAKPAVVALGKSAVMAAVGGGDFQKIASVQLGKAYNGNSNQNQGNGSKPQKKKTKGTFKKK